MVSVYDAEYLVIYGLDEVYEDRTGIIERGDCTHGEIFYTVMHDGSRTTCTHNP